MPDNKKIDEAPKAGASAAPEPKRNALDHPADKVKVPTVSEVKTAAAPSASKENIDSHVEAVAKSVEAANKSNVAVGKAEAGIKPETEKAPPAPTADERLNKQVGAVAKSVEDYNKSVELEKKSTPETSDTTSLGNKTLKPEVSRVAPLTGELRHDPEDDSYVTPGKVVAARTPLDDGTAPPAGPEPAPAPKVIAPLTGEVKPADEVSYPTPGHVKDPDAVVKAVDTKKFALDSKNTKFGVAEGQQVSLLHANHEAWDNEAAQREDTKAMAEALAQSMTSADGLRRTRRVQKNLR